MNKSVKNTFIRAWFKEYAATVKVNELQSTIEAREMLGKPTARQKTQLSGWEGKVKAAADKIADLIKAGKLPENAAQVCKEELRHIYGYVGDCYIALYEEFKPQ